MWNSLRVRLTLIFIGLAILPLIVVGGVLLQTTEAAAKTQAIELQSQVAQSTEYSVTNYYQGLNQDLFALGNQIQVLGTSDRTQYLILMNNEIGGGNYTKGYEELTLLDSYGKEIVRTSIQSIASNNQLLDHSKLDDYLQPASTHQIYYSPVRIDSNTGQPYFTISVPLFVSGSGRTSQLSGVLIAKVGLSALENVLTQAQPGPNQTLYVTDADGKVIAYQNSSFNLQNARVALPPSADIQNGINHVSVVLAVSKVQLGNQTFAVVAEQPTSVALSLVNNLINTLIIAVLFALLISAALGFLSVRQIVLPIEKLAGTAKQIAAGDLSQIASIRSRDEIGTLAITFNDMTSQLRNQVGNLERRVSERTAQIQAASVLADRRAAQFETIALIMKAIISFRQMSELLPQITTVISERFGYYHVGIFLNDEDSQNAVLSAANSEGGQRMLKRGHRLKIGEQGIVGNVALTGEIRIARNVGEDAVYFNNPDLPETLSEMALPLRSGNKVIGALDVQSKQADAFSQDDVSVLSLLADQVSLAIDNTRLFEATNKSLAEAEALYRQYLHQAWNRLPREERVIGYRYTISGSSPLESPVNLDANTQDDNAKDASRLIIPIKLRDELIGNLVIQAPQYKEWSQDQLDLIQAVADRVALSAENARLFDETSRRGERERMVTEITSKIRSTNNPDEMIHIALNELRGALGATQVQLIPQTVSAPNNDKTQKTSADPQIVDEIPNLHGAKK